MFLAGLLLLLQPAAPEVIALLHEAEGEITKIAKPTDRSNALWSVGHLYVRAGAVPEVERLAKKAGVTPYIRGLLATAQAVYADAATAIKTAKTAFAMPPAEAVGYWYSLANALWRVGKPEDANLALREGEAIARKIAEPAIRNGQIRQAIILRGSLANPHPLPVRIPWHKEKPTGVPVPNDFPITVEAFGPPNPKLAASRQEANARFLGVFYDYVGKSNIKGAIDLVEQTPDCFTRTLGLATIQHLASVSVVGLDVAATAVTRMGEDRDDCILAKAEAFGALALKYRAAGRLDEAGQALKSALEVARKSTADWGKAIVLAELGAKAAESGFTATANDFFIGSIAAADAVPHDVQRISKGIYTSAARFRGDLFGEIMPRMIRAADYGRALALAQRWRKEGGPSYSGVIVGVWLRAGRMDDALQFTRSLPTPKERADGLCDVARCMLDDAGAPNL